ncbi:PRC-barrel domain-containing protein [Nitrosococcus watsonii]|uniref:PRC-barrel domain protein n=1 Tax=Nitrosococcus watsoni (strain C-113) TaxID=105559 RepID=D8KA36_NITWC|nr:PRC-barrel domain-containing protein [Nitrosococcus watsonii]ADJ29394.1 PRC-barrel domain protein [Nitrosococcus watsonii C-113]
MNTPITTPPGSEQPRVIGGEDNTSGPGPYLMTANSLENNEVYNLEGEELGKIKDIMIDVPKGRIAYAVLSFGGILGMGDKLFAVPWNALTLDANEKCFVLRVNKEVLENDPGFDKDNWPSMADQRWASDVHSRYGTRPYWEGYTP